MGWKIIFLGNHCLPDLWTSSPESFFFGFKMPGRMDGYQKDTFLSHARNIGGHRFIASISILGPKKASLGPPKRHMKWGHLGPQFTVTFIWNFWKIPNEFMWIFFPEISDSTDGQHVAFFQFTAQGCRCAPISGC